MRFLTHLFCIKFCFFRYFSLAHRYHNKKVYVQKALKKLVQQHSCRELNRMIEIEVNGKKLDLPDLEGIIVLNIPRFAVSFYH